MNQMQIKKRRPKSGESAMIIAAIGRLQGNAPGRATVEAVFIEQ